MRGFVSVFISSLKCVGLSIPNEGSSLMLYNCDRLVIGCGYGSSPGSEIDGNRHRRNIVAGATTAMGCCITVLVAGKFNELGKAGLDLTEQHAA